MSIDWSLSESEIVELKQILVDYIDYRSNDGYSVGNAADFWNNLDVLEIMIRMSKRDI